MIRVLVDTNILLDFLMRRDPFFAAAARLFILVERGSIDAWVSAISFNNTFYVLRKQVGVERSLSALIDLRRLFRVVSLTEPLLDQAISRCHHDLEDTIQLVSASEVRASCVVSRDRGLLSIGGAELMTADEFVATYSL